MRLKNLIIAIVLIMPLMLNAQQPNRRLKKKDSKAAGTLFGYWGYNRTAYTKSNIRFVGPNYDFTLAGVEAKDRPTTSSGDYFSDFTIPQFNARIGYYFKEHWAFSLGYDHLKYVMNDNNDVFLSGFVGDGVDPVTGWNGTYSGEPVITKSNLLHYENSDGLNYLRLEVTRTDHLVKLGDRRDQFVISSNIGIGGGALLSYNDFKFGGEHDVRTISLSGYGISVHTGLRFEFFRHVFIQANLAAGIHHQARVKTRPFDASSFARHAYGFAEGDLALGFLLYIRPKNGCDSCPVW